MEDHILELVGTAGAIIAAIVGAGVKIISVFNKANKTNSIFNKSLLDKILEMNTAAVKAQLTIDHIGPTLHGLAKIIDKGEQVEKLVEKLDDLKSELQLSTHLKSMVATSEVLQEVKASQHVILTGQSLLQTYLDELAEKIVLLKEEVADLDKQMAILAMVVQAKRAKK